MKKSQLYVGIDTAKGPGSDTFTEVIILLRPDGTTEILDIYHWENTIDLPKDAYRVKDAKQLAKIN